MHVNLTRRYQKPYQQLCEGLYGDKGLAHEVLRPLKRGLRDYGNEPLQLIQQVATELDQVPAEPLLKQSVDWGGKSQRIDRRAQPIDGHPKAIGLALQACQRQLFVGIAPEVMRERLIRLHQAYVCEWDSVRDSVGEGLLDSVRMQGVA